MLALSKLAPELVYQEMRYRKFYGDPVITRDVADSGWLSRPLLLGSLWGARETALENGVLFGAGITQVLQGVVAGDSDDDANYVGSADVWLGLDSGRAGLWPGGLIFAHIEGNWGDPVSGSGALLPVNADSIDPGLPSKFALSELYLTQALSEQVMMIIGKADWAAFVDTTFFANNERTQFLNEGLMNNAALGAFVPYTALGAMFLATPTKELAIGGGVIQNAGNATKSGFDELDVDKLTFAGALMYNPIFGKLPGSYQMLLGYTSKDSPDFAVDGRYFIEEIIGVRPTNDKEGNYALTVTASQYVWVDESVSVGRGRLPVGFGPFLRLGFTPDDRNLIDQFYSVGVGGTGIPSVGRADDHWGVGWAGAHISSDFRGLAGDLGATGLDDFEHVVEAFYNFALTPAVSISLDIQYVNPTNSDRDDLVLMGTRLQLDL